MKRLEALIPLSHDHHHGLVMALRLKKGGPASPHDLWPADIRAQRDELLTFTNRELLPHFELEEDLLFPACLRSKRPELEAVVLELMEEHAAMRLQLAGLQASNDERSLREHMRAFGELLEPHIRKEERVFFPMAEEAIEQGTLLIDTEAIKSRHAAYEKPGVC